MCPWLLIWSKLRGLFLKCHQYQSWPTIWCSFFDSSCAWRQFTAQGGIKAEEFLVTLLSKQEGRVYTGSGFDFPLSKWSRWKSQALVGSYYTLCVFFFFLEWRWKSLNSCLHTWSLVVSWSLIALEPCQWNLTRFLRWPTGYPIFHRYFPP